MKNVSHLREITEATKYQAIVNKDLRECDSLLGFRRPGRYRQTIRLDGMLSSGSARSGPRVAGRTAACLMVGGRAVPCRLISHIPPGASLPREAVLIRATWSA